jgi:septal ring-binding cell division protein DamX
LDNGSQDFGLDIMGLVRPLKDYSVTRPLNLAEENSDIRERRLEDEKKKRNSQRANLRDAATKVEKQDNPKPVKSEAGPSGKVPPTLSS